MLKCLLPPAEAPLKLLCLGAHSDDIEIGCGGTVLTLLSSHSNVTVHWLVFSADGTRAREAEQSAARFLAEARHKEIAVKSFRDGYFPFIGGKIKDDFETLKQLFQPDLILTHAQEDRHQDHRLISDLTWNTFRDHLILEYEIPKYDGDLGRPNFFVPIEESTCVRKVRTILDCFQTQRSKHWFDEQTFLALMRLRGMEANSPTRLAEAFHCRKAVLGLRPSADGR
jgi:LmbE family N-acetylglucosaminyl deacetylase